MLRHCCHGKFLLHDALTVYPSTHSLVNEMDFSVVIFDTAPTGHTLRFLSMPNLFVKGMEKLGKIKGQFGSVFSQVIYIFVMYDQACPRILI